MADAAAAIDSGDINPFLQEENGGADDGNGHRQRLVAFYRQHNPAKIGSVDATLEVYRGREHELFSQLEKKYGVTTHTTPSIPTAEVPTTPPSSFAAGGAARRRAARGDDYSLENFQHVVDGIKRIYKTKVRPLEERFKFHDFFSPLLEDVDFEAKPLVLLLGRTLKTCPVLYLLPPPPLFISILVSNPVTRDKILYPPTLSPPSVHTLTRSLPSLPPRILGWENDVY